MLTALDVFAEDVGVTFGRVKGTKKDFGSSCGGLMQLIIIVLGSIIGVSQFSNVITRNGYSYTERSQLLSEEDFLNKEFRFGDFENGYQMFFGTFGPIQTQEENPISNTVYKYKVYEYYNFQVYQSKI